VICFHLILKLPWPAPSSRALQLPGIARSGVIDWSPLLSAYQEGTATGSCHTNYSAGRYVALAKAHIRALQRLFFFEVSASPSELHWLPSTPGHCNSGMLSILCNSVVRCTNLCPGEGTATCHHTSRWEPRRPVALASAHKRALQHRGICRPEWAAPNFGHCKAFFTQRIAQIRKGSIGLCPPLGTATLTWKQLISSRPPPT
jgi:hypothetical protein